MLRRRRFYHVRAAGADVLVAFVPDRSKSPPPIRAWIDQKTEMRLYPVKGGHLVKWPWSGPPPNAKHFRVETGGWNHEHCSSCNGTIEVEEWCWITARGSFFVLCESCRRRMKRLGKI